MLELSSITNFGIDLEIYRQIKQILADGQLQKKLSFLFLIN